MYYTVYKITNKINDKTYIGVHKTDNLDDGYMGSGTLLKRSQEKHGIENFDKEILEVFDNPEDMFNMESELVNEEFISRNDTYNLKLGGYGGWDHIDHSKIDHESLGKHVGNVHRAMIDTSDEYKEDVLNRLAYWRQHSHRSGKIRYDTFTGKKHTSETKKKISQSNKFKHDGNKNSQYGTIWIYNLDLKECKKIKKEEFQSYQQYGWLRGRKMKLNDIS